MVKLTWGSEIEEFETLEAARDRAAQLFGSPLYEQTNGNVTNFYAEEYDGVNPVIATLEVL